MKINSDTKYPCLFTFITKFVEFLKLYYLYSWNVSTSVYDYFEINKHVIYVIYLLSRAKLEIYLNPRPQ